MRWKVIGVKPSMRRSEDKGAKGLSARNVNARKEVKWDDTLVLKG